MPQLLGHNVLMSETYRQTLERSSISLHFSSSIHFLHVPQDIIQSSRTDLLFIHKIGLIGNNWQYCLSMHFCSSNDCRKMFGMLVSIRVSILPTNVKISQCIISLDNLKNTKCLKKYIENKLLLNMN